MDSSSVFLSYLRVTHHMSQHFRTHFGQMNLTFPQALVLTTLGDHGPVPISALAELTGSANSTVSGVMDRLEKLGLAKRERSEADRRVIYVSTTPKYQELRKRAEADVSTYFSSLFHDISPEDQTVIAQGLQLLDEVLTRREAEQTSADTP